MLDYWNLLGYNIFGYRKPQNKIGGNMCNRLSVFCLLMLFLSGSAYGDWQIERIDALKDDVFKAMISMNHSGEAAIIFTQMDPDQAPPARRLFATLYDPLTQTFTSPIVMDAGIDDNPDNFGVAIDEQGEVTVAFYQYDVADTCDHLFVNKFTPGVGWSGASGIFAIPWPGSLHDDPKVGHLSTGAVIVFYCQDTIDIHSLVAYREPGNLDFIQGASAPYGPGHYVLSTNGTNRACVAYEFYSADPVLRIYSSRFGYPSNSWSSPELVDRGIVAENIQPSLSLNSSGDGFLAFGYNSIAQDTLFANVLDPSTGWSGTTVIDSGAGDISLTWDMETDDFGNAMVVYNKWDSGLQGFGSYYQSGSGWSSPTLLSGSLGSINRINASFDTAGNAGAVFEFVAINRYVGANGFLPGSGWDIPDTVYGPSGSFDDLDIKAYGTLGAVAIFLEYADTNKLYAAIYTPTGVEEVNPALGKSPRILTCIPNPFAAQVKISLVGESGNRGIGETEIQIYDGVGRRVRGLILYPSFFILEATWDGKDNAGKVVSPGIYFVGVNGSIQQKLVKIK
jgi:hypothetical protein